ncbi:hypothetical protein PSTG_09708 [Puccinia striiformis f. sp. tritici PST-78]|uniref:CCHC-type domain-containing protein n=1 Tax=Puccinia striiformis f. sp. tritici PST-78 TaxID=1165861 RepID=A0A0L0VCH2_9BASI|nr:hypothetical protein PSTG_09708 [Puccinia striiformis f. sp. tritici PST-78]
MSNDLNKQFEELMSVVKEERKLRQAAETELLVTRQAAELAAVTAATNLANANAVATKAIDAKKGPKMGMPDKFDGTRGDKAEAWVRKVGLYMISHPDEFPDDHTKVIWSMSYLEGPALAWSEQFSNKLFRAEEVSYDNDFAPSFTSMYLDTEKKPKAEAAIRKLKQTKSVADYTHQFNTHATNTGWEIPTLVSQYRQGLKSNVRLALLISRAEFTSLAEISNLSLKIDNEINGTETTTTPATTSAPTADPNAMDLSAFRGQLSDSEKARMMRNGQCFRCTKPGHIARDCPEKKKGKGPTRISELEEELKQWKSGAKKFDGDNNAERSKNGGAQEATPQTPILKPRFLIDSGATHNVLSETYTKSARLVQYTTPSTRTITGFDGTKSQASSEISLTIDKDDNPSKFIVTRLKDAYDGILGMPWLESNGHCINWHQHKVQLMATVTELGTQQRGLSRLQDRRESGPEHPEDRVGGTGYSGRH